MRVLEVDPATRPVLAGFAASFGVAGLVLSAAMVGYGSLARDMGWGLFPTLLATVLIWALPAQILLMGGLASGLGLAAAVLAVSVSSIRLLPMAASILPLVRGPRTSLGMQLLASHYVSQTTWVEGFRALPDMPREVRQRFFLAYGNALIALATVAATFGYVLKAVFPAPLALGLLFMTPSFFLFSLMAGASKLDERVAFAGGLVLGPLFVVLLPGWDLLAAGVLGGALGLFAGLMTERRR